MQFVVHEFSGLGNQMFQYAAGRYYAQQHAAQLVLAVEFPRYWSSHGFPRPFLLSHFAIDAPYREMTRTERILPRLMEHPRLSPFSGGISAALRTINAQVIAEQDDQRFRFIAELPIRKKTTIVYLVGYWQAYKIAEAIADTLRRDFSLKTAPTAKNLATLRQIQQAPNAVSLHIRRGDYLLQSGGSVVLSRGYYTEAIERMKAAAGDATFFIFSDDMQFARDNIAPDLSAVFVDHNDSFAAHEDLRLMAACRHNIIANSTFSWWGAWLNPYPGKVVIAPRKWMVANAPPDVELFPPSWQLIA